MKYFDEDIDYYEILQVHPGAHQEVIKRAYRTIVGLLQAHPDLGGSHEDAVRVNTAFQILADSETRAAYDEARARRALLRAQASEARAAAAHGQRGNNHANGSRQAHAPSSPVQTVRCRQCGAKNRLPLTAEHQVALCGKCHATLFGQHDLPDPVWLPSGDMPLPPALLGRLLSEGELRLQRAQMPADRRLICLRCSHAWVEGENRAIPRQCPHCHNMHWSDFRLFRCRHCAHQFTTEHLATRPYRLFPECPACRQRRWHAGSERHSLAALLRTVLAGEKVAR